MGDVGYTFRKEFRAGWYTGKVVKIRPGAGEYEMFLHVLSISMLFLSNLHS